MNTSAHTIRLYLRAAKQHWHSGVLSVFLITVAVLANDIFGPYVISRIFELITQIAQGSADASKAYGLIWWLVATETTAFLAWRTVGFIVSWRQTIILRNLERNVFANLTKHSYDFFANRFGGALVAQSGRFVRGYESLEDTFLWNIYPMLVRLIASLCVLLVTLTSVGLALSIWIVIFVSSIIWLTRKKQPITRKAAETDTVVTARLSDVITNILNVKSFGRRREEMSAYDSVTSWRQRLRWRSWKLDTWIDAYQVLLIIALEVTVVWLSISLVASHKAGLASVLLAQFYVSRIVGDLWNIGDITKRISGVLGDTAQMTEILRMKPGIKDPKRPQRPRIKNGRIRFESIEFAYPGHPPVFKNFSLSIPTGQRVGLVGHSGSGKSTFVKMLLRFADLNKGRILIDGQDISKIAQDELRSQIAYVAQEPVLFHRSLMDNIRYGRPEATDEEVKEVARLAHAADFIEELPKGYGTLVGERGIKLSGGEKQRVAIARAMLSNASLLVLDEATSSLDSKSEALITDALKKLMAGRTTIVIAHRLSTIRNLDRILVMEAGQVVESGSHTELLKKKGVYAELWSHQSGGFLEE